MTAQRSLARDGERFAVHANGGDWLTAWHPAASVPTGTRHGAAGLCVTPDNDVVLVSSDGARWGLPGGRPEGDETWEETLRREVLEEACCTVVAARLLGFHWGTCQTGPEMDLVLVRAMWRAEVEVLPWAPRFEIAHRRIVPAGEVLAHLTIDDGFAPIYHRILAEAGLLLAVDEMQ